MLETHVRGLELDEYAKRYQVMMWCDGEETARDDIERYI